MRVKYDLTYYAMIFSFLFLNPFFLLLFVTFFCNNQSTLFFILFYYYLLLSFVTINQPFIYKLTSFLTILQVCD